MHGVPGHQHWLNTDSWIWLSFEKYSPDANADRDQDRIKDKKGYDIRYPTNHQKKSHQQQLEAQSIQRDKGHEPFWRNPCLGSQWIHQIDEFVKGPVERSVALVKNIDRVLIFFRVGDRDFIFKYLTGDLTFRPVTQDHMIIIVDRSLCLHT